MKALVPIIFAAMTIAPEASAQTPSDYHGPIIDTHAHVRLGEYDVAIPNQPLGTDALRGLDESAGVTSSALIVMARRGQIAETRAQNDAVIAAARAGGSFYAIASVHPLDGADALAEMDRLARLNVRVIKLHPNTQDFDVADPAVGTLIGHAGELGLILLFDSYKPWDTSELGKLIRQAIQHPRTRFIFAHMGMAQFREAVTVSILQQYGLGNNIWFDISAIAPIYADSPVEPELVWTMRRIGMSRFLFGSDWPAFTPSVAVDAVRRLGLTHEEQALVFHDNAVALLGLGARN